MSYHESHAHSSQRYDDDISLSYRQLGELAYQFPTSAHSRLDQLAEPSGYPPPYVVHNQQPMSAALHQSGGHFDGDQPGNASIEQPYLFDLEAPYSVSQYDDSALPSIPQHAGLSNSWPAYDSSVPQALSSIASPTWPSYPSSAPFQPPRIPQPPARRLSVELQHNIGRRQTLSGSLDPETGIFYRSPEHPRLRTAQACEKCRARKAKCTGDTPCGRCASRGLVCEYAREGRVRGPNKPKSKISSNSPDEPRSSRHRSFDDNHSMSGRQSATSQLRDIASGFSKANHHNRRRHRQPSAGHSPTEKFAAHEIFLDSKEEGVCQEGHMHCSNSKSPPLVAHGWSPESSDQSPMGYRVPNGTNVTSIPLSLSPLDSAHAFREQDLQEQSDFGVAISNLNVYPQNHHGFSQHHQGLTLATADYTRNHHTDECESRGSATGSFSNPHSAISMTFNSPHTSARESPPTPASSMAHSGCDGDHVDGFSGHLTSDIDHHAHREMSANALGPQPVKPEWAELRSNLTFEKNQERGNESGQYRRSPLENEIAARGHNFVGDTHSTVDQKPIIPHESPDTLNVYSYAEIIK